MANVPGLVVETSFLTGVREERTVANAVKSTANYIRKHPETEAADTLLSLCLALESGAAFELERIYQLDPKPFDLAIALLGEWRFDRHVTVRRVRKYLEQPDDED